MTTAARQQIVNYRVSELKLSEAKRVRVWQKAPRWGGKAGGFGQWHGRATLLCRFSGLRGVAMHDLLSKMSKLRKDHSAVTAMEYGLIAALIAVVIITALTSIGTNLNATFNTIAAKI